MVRLIDHLHMTIAVVDRDIKKTKQHTFCMRNKKNNFQLLSYLEACKTVL